MNEEIKEYIKNYIKNNLQISAFYEDSECCGQSITVELYLENEKISSCDVDMY